LNRRVRHRRAVGARRWPGKACAAVGSGGAAGGTGQKIDSIRTRAFPRSSTEPAEETDCKWRSPPAEYASAEEAEATWRSQGRNGSFRVKVTTSARLRTKGNR